jgi:hypothetical protein
MSQMPIELNIYHHYMDVFGNNIPYQTHPRTLERLLYQTSPMTTFYVIHADEILGPAAICRNTAPAHITVGGLGKVAERGLQSRLNPCAREDKGPDDTSGSELYRLNIWHMMWGSMIAVQPLPYRLDQPVTEKQQDRTLRVLV